MRILIVEDEPRLLRSLAKALREIWMPACPVKNSFQQLLSERFLSPQAFGKG